MEIIIKFKVNRTKIKYVVSGIWCLPAIVLVRMIRPIVLVRFCQIFSDRIGHLISDTAEHLARRKFRPNRVIDLYFFGKIANRQWTKMVQRSSLVVLGDWMRYLYRWNQIIPGGEIHELGSSQNTTRDTQNLFGTFDVALSFTDSENKEALDWLRRHGWNQGEPFVCLLVRDAKYLNDSEINEGNYEYHNYRDSDIDSYKLAIDWLNSKNVWVIRMGRNMSKRLNLSSKKFIDYAFDPERNDLKDIWLFANSNGVISTATGPDVLAAIYGKPSLYLNALRLIDITSWRKVIWVPKNLFWKDTKKELTLSEMLECKCVRTSDYDNLGIMIQDLSCEEILFSVKEFWQDIEGNFFQTESDKSLQQKFHNKLLKASLFQELHGIIDKDCRLGSYWLSLKREDFFN